MLVELAKVCSIDHGLFQITDERGNCVIVTNEAEALANYWTSDSAPFFYRKSKYVNSDVWILEIRVNREFACFSPIQRRKAFFQALSVADDSDILYFSIEGLTNEDARKCRELYGEVEKGLFLRKEDYSI